jgi:phage shock protein C
MTGNKKLHRSSSNRILGGVAAGLADYFEVDVTLVRITLLLLGLTEGIGILLYLALWLIMPEMPASQTR